MKVLSLALLIPVAICTACSGRQESPSTQAAPSAEAPASAPAPGVAPTQRPADAADPAQVAARASLTSAAGASAKGDLELKSEGLAVRIRGEITGLTPGKEHGFHVHEKGDCSLPDFSSAGEHLNPAKEPHGGPKAAAKHLGDLPNLKADESGHVAVDVSLEGATLEDKDGGPNQILGKALVVHAMPDDYKSQPAGDSGARIACGVIR
ncbi:MAG: superoxide dismutase family protein [Steroidobacteraceae bacterium]